jgi:hypothetical protein
MTPPRSLLTLDELSAEPAPAMELDVGAVEALLGETLLKPNNAAWGAV